MTINELLEKFQPKQILAQLNRETPSLDSRISEDDDGRSDDDNPNESKSA